MGGVRATRGVVRGAAVRAVTVAVRVVVRAMVRAMVVVVVAAAMVAVVGRQWWWVAAAAAHVGAQQEEAHGGVVDRRAVVYQVGVRARVQAVLLLLVNLAEVGLDAPLQRRVKVVSRPDCAHEGGAGVMTSGPVQGRHRVGVRRRHAPRVGS